ncbi:MAG: ATP-binding protein [Phototrophicaceae bacterium]
MIELPPHNWLVYGHDWAVNQFRKSLQHNRLRHAYLISGTDSIGKRTLAYSLAMAINAPHAQQVGNIDYEKRASKLIMSGNHPDIVVAEHDSKTGALKIEAVREVTNKLALKPFEATYRIAIMNDFEQARPQAQDALLKTLEEPTERAILILLVNNPDKILATINSRCQIINLRPLSLEDTRHTLIHYYTLPPDQADLLARICGGRIGWAIQAHRDPSILEQRTDALNLLEDILRGKRAKRFASVEGISKDKPLTLVVLQLWMSYWRDLMIVTQGVHLPITNIDRQAMLTDLARSVVVERLQEAILATRDTAQSIRDTNVNVRLALENLTLRYPYL